MVDNIDYNSLKHDIRAHTTRSNAIAIPGQPDKIFTSFEDRLYAELLRQHRRVGLFVSTKAGELRRKLDHVAAAAERADDAESGVMVARRKKRVRKLEREAVEAGDDVAALQRFVHAQVEAFRKILKKYRVSLEGKIWVCFYDSRC